MSVDAVRFLLIYIRDTVAIGDVLQTHSRDKLEHIAELGSHLPVDPLVVLADLQDKCINDNLCGIEHVELLPPLTERKPTT